MSGKFNKFLQLVNILDIFLTFLVSHFDISGKEDKLKQSENMQLISLTLIVFHLEISGKETNDEHPSNIQLISSILFVFHFEISGNDFNERHELTKLGIDLFICILLSKKVCEEKLDKKDFETKSKLESISFKN